MFNKTLIKNYLRIWTSGVYGSGNIFEWGFKTEESYKTMWFEKTNEFYQAVSNALNLGDDVKVVLDVSRGTWNRYSLNSHTKKILASSEKDVRELVKEDKSVQENTPSLRDSQRQKVYDWERETIDRGARLSDDEIGWLLDELVELYGTVGVNFVVTSAKKSYSTYFGWKNEIRLAEGWGRDMRVVLHEFAHHVDRSQVAHGERFVGVVMDLYELYLGASREKMKQRLDSRKIKYNENWSV